MNFYKVEHSQQGRSNAGFPASEHLAGFFCMLHGQKRSANLVGQFN